MRKRVSKKKILKNQKVEVSKELQSALDHFPKIVKRNEGAAREKKRIQKNFLSVKDKVYKS